MRFFFALLFVCSCVAPQHVSKEMDCTKQCDKLNEYCSETHDMFWCEQNYIDCLESCERQAR